MTELSHEKPKRRCALKIVAGVVGFIVIFSIYYVRTHPLIFNESFWEHAHCIKQASGFLTIYARDNGGRFPFHTNGYGDALLLMEDAWLSCLTGPGYDTAVLESARLSGEDVPEAECGRVYVQGLSETNSADIALLFDKLSTPGDHRHFLSRIGAPLIREVIFVDGSMKVIPQSEWSAFAKKQITLLVEAGLSQNEAENYYLETLQSVP